MNNTHGPNGSDDRAKRLHDVPPIHDLDLERQFVGACIVYSELILSSGVVESDFYSPQYGVVWNALVGLAADGEPIGTAELRGRLHDSGRLASVGGDEAILGLTDILPSKAVDSARLRRLAGQRRLQEISRRILRAGPDEIGSALAAFELARRDLESVSATGPRAPSLEQCIPEIALTGPRLPIGLPTLDEATRGGVPMGRFISVIGAPGASKTNLSTWLGDRWERSGCGVLYVAADESRASIVTRIGQLDGFDRDLLEGVDPGRRNAFARNARGRAIVVVDPFADKITLEQCEAELINLARGRPRVLIVDSLQRVPASGSSAFETRREQLEYIVELLDGVAKRGTLVIAISEMSRAGYRTGKRDTDISALAAGAETRAIEYASHLQLGLKPVRGEQGVIDLEVSKNRLGPDKPEIRLKLDFSTLTFNETSKPVDDDADRERSKANTLRTRILATVVKEDLRTVAAIVRAAGVRKRDGNAMIRELTEEGLLKRVEGVYRYVAPSHVGGVP